MACRTCASRRSLLPVRSMSRRAGVSTGLPCPSRRRRARCPSLRSTPTTGPSANTSASGGPIPTPHVCGGGGPRGGEIAASPARLAGDRIRHRLAAGDPRHPLVGSVGEYCRTGQDVAAVYGVGQMLELFRQAQADVPGRGDGDGEVAERFITRPVGLNPITGTVPALRATGPA